MNLRAFFSAFCLSGRVTVRLLMCRSEDCFGEKLGKLNASVGVCISVDVLIQLNDCIRAPHLLGFLEYWVCVCARRSQ